MVSTFTLLNNPPTRDGAILAIENLDGVASIPWVLRQDRYEMWEAFREFSGVAYPVLPFRCATAELVIRLIGAAYRSQVTKSLPSPIDNIPEYC